MKPTNVLFIGNSFTNRNDLPGMLADLAVVDAPPHVIHTRRVIANGMSLKAHWTRGAARDAIGAAQWDYVVLQEQSTLPLKNRQRMHESVTLFDGEIRDHGARTVLYMTWARRHEFHRQAELSDAYLSVGRALGCVVVPVGIAWQHALEANPQLVLHDADNSHPNLAGSYLGACVFFSMLLGKSPAGLRISSVEGKLDGQIVRSLQEIAWQTVSTNPDFAPKTFHRGQATG